LLLELEKKGLYNMSEEGSFWIGLAERFFGLLITVIGVLMLYFTLSSTDNLNVFTGVFVFISAVLILVGLFLLLVRPRE
jgi:hypothetical protein